MWFFHHFLNLLFFQRLLKKLTFITISFLKSVFIKWIYVCVARELDGYKFLNNSQDAHEKQKNLFFDYAKGRQKKTVDHKKIIHFVCCDFIIHESLQTTHLSLNPASHENSWEMKIIKLFFFLWFACKMKYF